MRLMVRVLAVLLMVTPWAAIPGPAAVAVGAATQVFVAPDGDDGGSGSEAEPYRTDHHDYRLQPGSPALDLGFQPIDTEAIGPR